METNRLRQFVTVATTGNLRRAAELLGMSHGALSKSVKALEVELGTKLLRQSGRGIEVTREGRALAARAPAVLQAVDSLRPDRAADSTPFRLATFEVFSTHFLAPLAALLGTDARLQILEAVPGAMEDRLLRDEADLGVTYLPIPRPGLRFQRAATLEMAIFGRTGSFPGMPTEQLPFAIPLAPVDGAPSGVKGLDGWPDHLFQRNIRYEMDLMETALALCRRGLAVAFLPRFVVELHNTAVLPSYRLTERALPRGFGRVRREVFIVARSGEEESRFEKIVAKALRKLPSLAQV